MSKFQTLKGAITNPVLKISEVCRHMLKFSIHIQCMPEAEGLDYDGMPIIKDIGPIKLDPETE